MAKPSTKRWSARPVLDERVRAAGNDINRSGIEFESLQKSGERVPGRELLVIENAGQELQVGRRTAYS